MLARCVRPLVNKLSGVCRLSKYTQTTGRGLSRGFAQAPANINKAEQKLVKILNQEIEFEEDNYAEDNAVTPVSGREQVAARGEREDQPDCPQEVIRQLSGPNLLHCQQPGLQQRE